MKLHKDVYPNHIAKLLIQNGATEAQTEEMVEQALEYYLNHLPAALARDGVVRILPGVLPLLEKLSADSRFALGLVTGNVYEGARIKLSRGNLFAYFPVGAFGDDALKREELPPFAIQRAEKYFYRPSGAVSCSAFRMPIVTWASGL